MGNRNMFPVMPFRLNLIVIFSFALAALIVLHLTDRRAGGE